LEILLASRDMLLPACAALSGKREREKIAGGALTI
jgi:hypothetical protein